MLEPLGTPKSVFLESVRHSLDRRAVPPEPAYPHLMEDVADLEAQVEQVQARLAESRDRLLDQLARVAQSRGWNVSRFPNPEDAIAFIESLAAAREVGSIVRSDQEVFDRLPLDASMRDLGVSITTIAQSEDQSREALREEIVAAGIGITGADYAVAETGSVVVMPRRGLSRLVSLVPPIHIALVQPDDVIESMDDLFLLRRLEYHRQGGEMGSYLNFITGPSRTADIEQTLVVGVHGPKEVHLLLLG